MFGRNHQNLSLPEDRGPLRVMFVHTEVVVGGAETLLLEIIRNLDRTRFAPELCCLKRLSELGEVISKEMPTHTGLLKHKFDYRVLRRLTALLRDRKIDAVVTIGTGGDRMFWGRLAGWRANVPVILSALHATGYPMKVERLNRLLTPLTDGFIGCAKTHSKFLVASEGCPQDRVFTIWNGVDVGRFRSRDRAAARRRLGLDERTPVAGIVAALRPEKQHLLLLEAWSQVVRQNQDALLLIVGEGPERSIIESRLCDLKLSQNVHLLGTRHDIPEVLSALDLKVLSSRMEANPASTLEAGACGLPVVAPNVGSLPDTITDGETGLLVKPNDATGLANAITRILASEDRGRSMGKAAQQMVQNRFSLDVMVGGYEALIDGVYRAAVSGNRFRPKDLNNKMDLLSRKLTSQRDREGQKLIESEVS